MTAVIASEPMDRLMEMIERVARSSATILITGESGTGKEVVARAVHYYSMRSQKPWVDLSCAALPEHLLESELFGYERGAFSGANSTKQGLFELAHMGTIFLDEIGELDPKMQVKLLRVLDGVPYYRLGGVKKVSVDVRVVAATNQDLEAGVAEGRFRSDLYHRLSQITLRVPPLRQRIADIAPLAHHFLMTHNSELHFAPSALDALETHFWPGNIRELRNVVIKAAVLATRPEIRAEDLHLPAAGDVAAYGSAFPIEIESGEQRRSSSLEGRASSLEKMERRMILEALEATNGHQQQAAARLGISRRTLSRKLKLYDTDGMRAAL